LRVLDSVRRIWRMWARRVRSLRSLPASWPGGETRGRQGSPGRRFTVFGRGSGSVMRERGAGVFQVDSGISRSPIRNGLRKVLGYSPGGVEGGLRWWRTPRSWGRNSNNDFSRGESGGDKGATGRRDPTRLPYSAKVRRRSRKCQSGAVLPHVSGGNSSRTTFVGRIARWDRRRSWLRSNWE